VSVRKKVKRKITPEVRQLMVKIEADSIRSETKFVADYRHLNNDELQKAANEAQMLSLRLHHMLWKRFEQRHEEN
jgi:hypothetical protein